MLDFVIALCLALAFFFIAVVFYRGHFESNQGMHLLVLAVCLIAVSGFLVVWQFGTLTVYKKIVGIILTFFGGFMVVKFPQPGDYQPKEFSLLGILIGLFCLFLGLYWVLF
ncbi:MAG: hypothetical protein KAU95_01215 [Candidatus Aenigmarchaeota archaeon]|nr:hypothetical protein [Candidatus Aenigmarchaeota archaeon]